jgi:hypothetical protein
MSFGACFKPLLNNYAILNIKKNLMLDCKIIVKFHTEKMITFLVFL